MKQEILISGFGGQGMMSLGKILAKAALLENRRVTGFPSYGAEIRGGTAHCFIKISNSPIASPFINRPDTAIILNQPSWDKFKNKLAGGCVSIVNSDLIDNFSSRLNSKTCALALNKIALSCGSIKTANIVALGALISLRPGLFKKRTIIKVLKETFKAEDVQKQNLKAFDKGMRIVKNNES